METAEIVKIAVSAAPYSIDKPYDYLVPPELLETAVPGVRVTVPFGRGNRTSEGIILARTPGEKMQGLKPLLSVLDRGPVLDGDGIALALWLRQRYFCTLFEAVKAILPAGLWYQIREVWHVAEGMDRCAADGAATGIRRPPRCWTPCLPPEAPQSCQCWRRPAARRLALCCGHCRRPGSRSARLRPAGGSATSPVGWWNWPSAPRRPHL